MYRKTGAKTKSTRHYYSSDRLFEKSLDIYKPCSSGTSSSATYEKERDLPIVIVVVGSGWVGHRAFAYGLCSWWNASGPQTIASLGTTCVCVRHRGAFCVLPPTQALVEFLILVLAVVGAMTGGQWDLAVGVTLIVALLLTALALGGQGSASLQDMWTDVAQALEWIHTHPELLLISKSTCSGMESLSSDEQSDTSDSELETDNTTRTDTKLLPPLVFGGYSSGGHVAATLLQQPELFLQHNLPPPQDLFDGILMISGMMAVRPGSITLPDNTNHHKPITIGTPPKAPQWLTNLVVCAVWGPEEARRIPSPLTLSLGTPPPNLPHVLLGCRHEVFGLDWLNVFFSSQAYAKMVQASTGQSYSKYVQVESDHWNVLNSLALKEALQVELPRLAQASREQEHQP